MLMPYPLQLRSISVKGAEDDELEEEADWIDHTMKAYKKQISSWKKKIRASDYFPRCLNLRLRFIHWSTRTTELLLKQHYHDLESDEVGSERDDFKAGQPAVPLTTTSYKQKTAEVVPPDC